MVYSTKHKMAELMSKEPRIASLIGRFGIPFGVGDQTIEEVCQAASVDAYTFLSIVNFQLHHQSFELERIDVNTVKTYIKNAHDDYLQYRLPNLRRTLLEAMPSEDDHQVVVLILRYYDAFVQLLRKHMRDEDAGAVKVHERDNQHIVRKIDELINIIVKYYPGEHSSELSPMVVCALESLYHVEEDILAHCEIEDQILVPAMALQHPSESKDSNEVLSDRETDVLIEIVNGNSNKQIADHLCLSIHTVISHRKNIVRKLDIHSTAGLTIYAVVNNLVQLEQLKTNIKGL